MSLLTPDLCIIGDSAGGLRAALLAAAFGLPTVLIRTGAQDEADAIGKHALLAAAAMAEAARHASRFGIETGPVACDFARVTARVHATQAEIAPRHAHARLRALGLHVLEGPAFFETTQIVATDAHRVAARRIILAPSARTLPPALPGLEPGAIWTPDTILSIPFLPRRLAVVGDGPEALEFAQAFRRLGSSVSLVAPGPLLPGEDEEQADTLAAALRRDGVRILTGSPVTSLARDHAGAWRLAAAAPSGEIPAEADAVLFCTGASADLGTLGLAAAGIGSGPRGIHVDRRLRTDNPAVFAIGPAAAIGGRATGLHGARAQADLVMRQVLFRLPGRYDPHAVPRVAYTDPEWAAIGWDEAGARERHGAISVLRSPFAAHERAMASDRVQGHAKILLDRRGRLLGASITGPGAADLIAPWAALLGQKPNPIRLALPPDASFADTPRRAVMEAYAPLARSKMLRALSALLRRFG